MKYDASKTAGKGGNELIVMVLASIVATKLLPLAKTIGIDIDPTVLAVSIVAGLGTAARVVGNWWKHRKDGK